MSRKGQSIALSISAGDKAELEKLALELGFTWGERANISKLVEAIARREMLLHANNDWSKTRIETLDLARKAAIDAGNISVAIEIAKLLVERSELSIPLRQEIDRFIEQPIQPWRMAVDRYIHRKQPFQLSYQDAAERVWEFTIHHAQIAVHEERQYLDCWCVETDGSQDLPALSHNRCLRIDRITDAAIAPVKGIWRSNLATIAVEIHLYGGLAFAYQSKTTSDSVNEWHPDRPNVRRVIREVSNTFWFIREILCYGKDCEIFSPKPMRDRFQQQLQGLINLYQDTAVE
jgi:hypothetical protein